jgi:RIO kinase 2
MSEYNVFVNDEGVTVFDWPQSVPVEHENADELLERDVENLLGYFQRKYPGQCEDWDARAVAERLRDGEFSSIED